MIRKVTFTLLLAFCLASTITQAGPHNPWNIFLKTTHTRGTPAYDHLDKTSTMIERPISQVSIGWDTLTNKWADTLGKITLSWNGYGLPDQLIMTGALFGSKIRIIASDFIPLTNKPYSLNDLVSTKQEFSDWIGSRWMLREGMFQTWNGSAWVDSQKFTGTYDYATKTRTSVNQSFVGGNWEDASVDTTVYSEYGDEMYNVDYTKNGAVWELEFYSAIKLIKNAQGQLTGVEQGGLDYSNNGKIITAKHLFNLDANGRIATSVSWKWSFIDKIFKKTDSLTGITWDTYIPDKLDIYQENSPLIAGGNGIATLDRYFWDINNWENTDKYNITYNPDHTLKTSTQQHWVSSWEISRTSATYYANQDEKESISEKQNGSNWDLESKTFDDNKYDADGSLTENIYQEWNNGKYVNQVKRLYQYTSVSAINDAKAENTFAVYPNPASSKLYIDPKSQAGNLIVRIWSVTGKEMRVLADINNGITKLDISSLPPGMYVLQTESDGIQQVSKFVKE